VTLHQMAGIVRAEEAQPTPCTPTVQDGGTAAGQVALAFAEGDGAQAASLIGSLGLTNDPTSLGSAVFYGGIASTAARTFDGTRAVQSGLTADEGFLGGRTVLDTYEAYAKHALGIS
jgi:hypothetical protein